jgi:hypothetical protein
MPAMNASGVTPAFSAASMIGVPWVSSALTKRTASPAMRRARTQMSAWM